MAGMNAGEHVAGLQFGEEEEAGKKRPRPGLGAKSVVLVVSAFTTCLLEFS